MIDELRGRIAMYLSQNQICVISTSGYNGAACVRAKYSSHGLDLDCRVPRWSDTLYHLEQDPQALLIILDGESNASRWMQYRGIAQIAPYTPADRDVRVQITPVRIDLMDESRAWGARETLQL